MFFLTSKQCLYICVFTRQSIKWARLSDKRKKTSDQSNKQYFAVHFLHQRHQIPSKGTWGDVLAPHLLFVPCCNCICPCLDSKRSTKCWILVKACLLSGAFELMRVAGGRKRKRAVRLEGEGGMISAKLHEMRDVLIITFARRER